MLAAEAHVWTVVWSLTSSTRLSNSDAQACSAARRCRVTRLASLFRHIVAIPTFADTFRRFHFFWKGGPNNRPHAAPPRRRLSNSDAQACSAARRMMSRDRALRRYSDMLSRSRHAPTRSVVFSFSGKEGRTTGQTPARRSDDCPTATPRHALLPGDVA